MAEPSAFERLVAADSEGQPITLEAHEVSELLEDLEFLRDQDNELVFRIIEQMTGHHPNRPN